MFNKSNYYYSMKTKVLLALVCAMGIMFSSCNTTSPDNTPDDTTKFSTESIIGTWVMVDSANNVGLYYDVKSNKHLLCVEKKHNAMERAIYNPSDGYLHVSSGVAWSQFGDLAYVFDESKQMIRSTSGTFYGTITVEDLAAELGSDEVFEVKRLGLDEAYLYSKINGKTIFDFFTLTVHDAHVFRIKGIKEDLE